ncbi:TM2 domain-containing protein CG10795-like [Pomacea canaliculata]|uniref:TM2 domain-containing protein CG10795-like n=1 Tax=Pomacea canaliculata TaxID=400727 RepID=UPI000D738350|nr:TM2 domain-containing protein CG10795-like [Pomacea canaliculata]
MLAFPKFTLRIVIQNCFILWLSLMYVNPQTEDPIKRKCDDLMLGQYLCNEPEIDPDTQQARGCDETRRTKVTCELAPNVTCAGAFNGTFQKSVACKWTNGHSFEKALLLSVFLGMFGIDRFYLGYPAIGLVKFATLGFLFLGQLVDILLIATQVVKPSDGSEYVIDYYGASTQRIIRNNLTYLSPPDYS